MWTLKSWDYRFIDSTRIHKDVFEILKISSLSLIWYIRRPYGSWGTYSSSICPRGVNGKGRKINNNRDEEEEKEKGPSRSVESQRVICSLFSWHLGFWGSGAAPPHASGNWGSLALSPRPLGYTTPRGCRHAWDPGCNMRAGTLRLNKGCVGITVSHLEYRWLVSQLNWIGNGQIQIELTRHHKKSFDLPRVFFLFGGR